MENAVKRQPDTPSTLTTEGWIRHLKLGAVVMPVALVSEVVGFNGGRELVKDAYGRPTPERDEKGRLLYVTPGGGRTVRPIRQTY